MASADSTTIASRQARAWCSALVLLLSSIAAADEVLEGRELAFNRDKGNCLACHAMAGGELPGNVAPPLLAMKQRYPDRAALAAQIADATVRNPASTMPPFGRHRILSEREIDLIVTYLYTL